MAGKSCCVGILLVSLLVSIAISAVLAFMLLNRRHSEPGTSGNSDPYSAKVSATPDLDFKIQKQLLSEFDAAAIRENLLKLTRKVHLAGTDENNQVGDMLKSTYTKLGFDEVKVTEYDVLLGYPDFTNPNTLHVKDVGDTEWSLLSSGKGNRLGPAEAQLQQADPKALVWYYAYSPSGEVTGPLVYAGYGSKAEMDYVESQGISINGSILLIRSYGGDVFGPAKRGAKAVLGYVDPQNPQFAVPGNFPRNFTFPNSMYMPKTDVLRFQRINYRKMFFILGDLLTESYPAKPYVYRELDYAKLQDAGILPRVPSTQVGMDHGAAIFNSMDGQVAPPRLTGSLQGVTYRLNAPGKAYKLKVNAVNDNRRRIRNVCSYLRGTAEPDHLVLLSNHYDAWTFGAFDPNSATAVMLEAARVLMKVVKEMNWRPKRTLAFCHWDAEEHNVIGSNEWVEEYAKVLQGRAVAVLNVDIAVEGNTTMVANGVPLLYRTLWDAAKLVPNPNSDEVHQGRPTVYDSWLHYFPLLSKPFIFSPRPDSDYYPFMANAGIPVAWPVFICAPKPCYGLYHTMYEVEWSMEHLVDRDFTTNRALGQVWLEMARSLSDSVVIPFSVTYYASDLAYLAGTMDTFLRSNNMTTPDRLPDYNGIIERLQDAIGRLTQTVEEFQSRVDMINSGRFSNANKIRYCVINDSGNTTSTIREVQILNNRMIEFERAFINPRGLYGKRHTDRHIIFSRSFNRYTFPAIVDTTLLYQAVKTAGNVPAENYWIKQLRHSITDVQYSIESAILVLQMS